MDLKVIEISTSDGRASVVIADQAHDPSTARRITMEFPIEQADQLRGYLFREARVAGAAESLMRYAIEALQER